MAQQQQAVQQQVSADDPRLQRCGFAKLQGEDFDFFIRKYEVHMGRRSKNTELDIVLGDNMNISRKHASIRFNFEKGVFELVVLGKNGVTISGVLHTPNSGPVPLRSQDLIQLGDRSLYFLLPVDPTRKVVRAPPPKLASRPQALQEADPLPPRQQEQRQQDIDSQPTSGSQHQPQLQQQADHAGPAAAVEPAVFLQQRADLAMASNSAAAQMLQQQLGGATAAHNGHREPYGSSDLQQQPHHSYYGS